MFERKFEFIVHHPLEVCEERILDMNKSESFLTITPRISSEITSSQEDYLEVIIRRIRTLDGQTKIEARIERVDVATSNVVGIAVPIDNLFMSYLVVGIILFLATTFWGGLLIGIVILAFMMFLIAVDTAWTIFWREWLIRKLEKTLTQPKKKKRT
jgi:hypothetical protein